MAVKNIFKLIISVVLKVSPYSAVQDAGNRCHNPKKAFLLANVHFVILETQDENYRKGLIASESYTKLIKIWLSINYSIVVKMQSCVVDQRFSAAPSC